MKTIALSDASAYKQQFLMSYVIYADIAAQPHTVFGQSDALSSSLHCTSGNLTAMSPDCVMYRTQGSEGYCN